jgi:hypothetical protein
MSERGQGQDQGQQQYVVKVDFTDSQGKKWTVGSPFKGDPDAVRRAIAAGQIAERPKPEPTNQDQEPEKGSFSSGEA